MFPTHLILLSLSWGTGRDIVINNFCSSLLHSSPSFKDRKSSQAQSGFCTPDPTGPPSYSYSDASVHAGDKLNQLSKFCTVYSSLRLRHSSSSPSSNVRGCQLEDVNHPFTLSSSCHALHRVTPVPTFVLISLETPCFIPLASPSCHRSAVEADGC